MNYIQYMKDPAGPIKNLSKLNLLPHDYFTLASIAGDLGALGLSLSGFSPAAAATGAASTTSQLIGDIKRDGFLLKDLGWAALGYGLDAVSLIPFGGAAALLAKAAPKLAKAAPIVLGLGTAVLSGLGIASSVPAFKKVVNGEKLTMDDYRLMTNALMAVVGLGRLGKAVYDNNKLPTSNDIVTEMSNALQPVLVNLYGKVKYYGPTMGKTTAAKTNPNLVDFDDVVREPIALLAKLKGVSVRDLKIANDPDYVRLLETEMLRWKSNPENAAKTLVISNKALSNSTGFNNLPVIPDKETFILRLLQRGGGTREEAATYYDALIAHNPDLKIDNRFVSDIESGTRAASITEAERLGIPKGERNLLYKKGYRKLYPQDVLINLEKEKRQIRNLFKSKIYQDRLLADGYTLSEIDDFINKYIFMDKFIKAPAVLDKLMFELGLAFHDYVKVRLPKNFETALHEYGHLSEYPSMWTDIKLPKITEAIFPYNSRYYLEPGEIRTRALGVLLWLNENGKTIDDFYNLKDPYTALGENRRAFLFLSAYPEDQGRNYLMHFRKQGGKLNYLNLMGNGR